jgi:hypothetical protein
MGSLFRMWLARKILPRAKRAYAWAAMQLIDDHDILSADEKYNYANYVVVPDHMRAVTRQVVERELDQIMMTARIVAFNTESEQDVIASRLARRYDPGMALNEAFNRTAEKMDQELSPNQQAALAFQQKFLRENAKRGPS